MTVRRRETILLFEELLNNYIIDDRFKQNIGTTLKEQDEETFSEYHNKWIEECKKAKLILKSKHSSIHRRFFWKKSLTEEEIKKEGLKTLRTMGIV